MKHEVLFLEINSSYSHSMLSYGLLRSFTSRMLPEWHWRHLDATLKSDEDKLLKQIIEHAPEVIAATGYLFNIEYLCRILERCAKEIPDTMIFLGGPEFLGCNMNFLMDHQFISGVIRGDESSFYLLLRNLHRRENWSDIPGLCYMQDGTCSDNGIALYPGRLDELPSPYAAGYIHSGKPFYQIETSRGCIGKCTFCTSANSEGVAYYSPERIKSDLECIRQSGIREMRLIDRTFNDDSKRAIGLLKMFYTDFRDFKFHLELNPAMLTEPLLACLRQAPQGMLHIETGIQTLNAASLKAIRRPASRSKSLTGLKQLVNCRNFAIHADLIAGLPGQSFDDVLSDVEELINLGPEEIQLEKLKFLPGTVMRETPPPGTVFNANPPYEVISTQEINEAEFITVNRLSIVLDAWYNASQLNSPFVLACRRIDGFIRKFIIFLENEKYFSGQGREALERRFELLEKFIGNDALLSQHLRFCRLAIGLPVSPEHLLTIKGETFRPQENTLSIIWRKDIEYRIGKYFQVDFDYNISDLWLNPGADVISGKKTYLFGLYYGRKPAEISEIIY
ncbi:MAG: DUF4080 domain-containing protein [Victivallaceae bacterium]|jgi:radical SAM superfamily enzyme YgiQ (UPF0313 family)